MKSLKHVIALSLLVVFAVGCGKESKSSGGGSTAVNPYTNPYLDSTFNGTSSENLAALNAWLVDNQVEPSNAIGGSFVRKTSNISGFSFEWNFSWNNNYNPTDCYIMSSDRITYGIGKPDSNGNCNNLENFSKSTFTKLVQAINGDGSLFLKSVQRQGTVYQLNYGPQNSYTNSTQLIHVIDTALPSFVNPVQTHDYRSGKKDVLSSFR